MMTQDSPRQGTHRRFERALRLQPISAKSPNVPQVPLYAGTRAVRIYRPNPPRTSSNADSARKHQQAHTILPPTFSIGRLRNPRIKPNPALRPSTGCTQARLNPRQDNQALRPTGSGPHDSLGCSTTTTMITRIAAKTRCTVLSELKFLQPQPRLPAQASSLSTATSRQTSRPPADPG